MINLHEALRLLPHAPNPESLLSQILLHEPAAGELVRFAFDEAKHPRNPKGSAGGGRFT